MSQDLIPTAELWVARCFYHTHAVKTLFDFSCACLFARSSFPVWFGCVAKCQMIEQSSSPAYVVSPLKEFQILDICLPRTTTPQQISSTFSSCV